MYLTSFIKRTQNQQFRKLITMNDLEKAIALLNNRSFKLADISKETDIPLITIRIYSSKHDKLRTAAWERVYKLARLYDKKTKLD